MKEEFSQSKNYQRHTVDILSEIIKEYHQAHPELTNIDMQRKMNISKGNFYQIKSRTIRSEIKLSTICSICLATNQPYSILKDAMEQAGYTLNPKDKHHQYIINILTVICNSSLADKNGIAQEYLSILYQRE